MHAGGVVKEHPTTYRITDLALTERPRERLANYGAGVLSSAELLAILIRVGVPGENAVQVGQRLLHKFDGLQGLHKASYEEVCNEFGIGPAKAAQIKAALELGNRLAQELGRERPSIHSPSDAANLLMHDLSGLEQEELHVVCLDTRNRVMFTKQIYKGSLNSSQVRVGELFKEAIRRSAASIIVVHNHPSGDPTPSPEDVAITRAIVQAGKLVDIDVLDHLVIANWRYVSLKERGLGFT
jgi:DNA repair protein RadC